MQHSLQAFDNTHYKVSVKMTISRKNKKEEEVVSFALAKSHIEGSASLSHPSKPINITNFKSITLFRTSLQAVVDLLHLFH